MRTELSAREEIGRESDKDDSHTVRACKGVWWREDVAATGVAVRDFLHIIGK